MARRLPVYLLIDTSGSMYGEPIEAVRNGIRLLQDSLNYDPYAFETAWVSVITFDSDAKQVTPLTPVTSFQAPDIQAGGRTSLDGALKLLADCVKSEVQKTTAEQKGDWKPLVFIMTDGVPTDSVEPGIEAIRPLKLGTVVGCAVGPAASDAVLKQITENVVALDRADSSTIKQFFKWVTASISVSSNPADRKYGEEPTIGDLPPPPPVLSIL